MFFPQLAVANPKWSVINKFKSAKFIDKVGAGRVFLTVDDAVDAFLHLRMTGLASC